MSQMEVLAISIVFITISIAGFIVNWALSLKRKSEYRVQVETSKRMELELRNEIDSKDLDTLVNESNERHGRN